MQQLLVSVIFLAASALAQEPRTLDVSQLERTRSLFFFSGTLDGGERCGDETEEIGDWDVETEVFWWLRDDDANDLVMETQGGLFDDDDGVFTAPVDGIYELSGFMRCQSGTCDVTLNVDGDIVAGFGTNIPSVQANTWSTHGVSKVVRMRRGDEAHMELENTGEGDCILSTPFMYGQFNVRLVFADEFFNEDDN